MIEDGAAAIGEGLGRTCGEVEMKGVAEEQRVMPHKGRFDRSTDPHVAMAVMSKIQFEDNEQRRRSDEGLSSASLSSLVCCTPQSNDFDYLLYEIRY